MMLATSRKPCLTHRQWQAGIPTRAGRPGGLHALRISAFLEQKKKLEPPVIDAEQFLAKGKQQLPTAVAQQVAEAGSKFGCFQLVNHGVSLDLISEMQGAMRDFFALPLEKKLTVKRTDHNPNGYPDDELTKQVRDLKEIFDFQHEIGATLPGFVARNQWPAGEPNFKRAMEAYLAEMSRVSFRLLEGLSVGLGLPADTLYPAFQDEHTSFMRLNYYPATPPEEKGLALNDHTDAGFLTILIQDVKVHGLEFFAEGEWHSVTPAPDALTINVGDQAQVLTNNNLQAPRHRVRSPHNGQARYSAPFFFNPRADAVIAPLPAFVTPQKPAAFKPIPWREFRELRIAGDYSDKGEEVQISHYRL